MFYLVLKRDLERISLARKHVLSTYELDDACTTIKSIVHAVWIRIGSLGGKSENRVTPLQCWLIFIGIFEEQNLDAKDRFEVFARGLVRVFILPTKGY